MLFLNEMDSNLDVFLKNTQKINGNTTFLELTPDVNINIRLPQMRHVRISRGLHFHWRDNEKE